MKVKNWLFAFVLMIMPMIVYCHELDDAYDCKFEWYASGNKSKITFPSDKDCYQTSVSYDYITEDAIISLSRGSYNFRSYSSVGNCGYEIEEILYFTIKSKYGTYGPFEWNKKLYETGIFGCYKDDYKGSVESASLIITYSTIKEIFFNSTEKELKNLGEKATVTFQVLTKGKIYRGNCHESERNDKSFTVKGKPVSIQLFQCASGKIGANPARTPNIEESDRTAKYCIYPTPVGSASDNVMQITNIQSPGYYNRNLYFSWNLYNKDNEKVSEYNRLVTAQSNENELGKFATFKYSDLGDYKVGDKYTLTRSISFTNQYKNELNCHTPALTFEIVPEAFLSEKGVNSVKVCPKNVEQPFSKSNGYRDPDWMYLKGEVIKFRDSDNRIVTLSDAMYDAYGIKYGWEYSIDKENWISLIDKTDVGTKILPNGESNYICNFLTQPSVKEYDLLVPNNMFADGKTRYFRQVVTLTNFSNRKIVSEKLHEVTPY